MVGEALASFQQSEFNRLNAKEYLSNCGKFGSHVTKEEFIHDVRWGDKKYDKQKDDEI